MSNYCARLAQLKDVQMPIVFYTLLMTRNLVYFNFIHSQGADDELKRL